MSHLVASMRAISTWSDKLASMQWTPFTTCTFAWLILGAAAVVATTGVAHAQGAAAKECQRLHAQPADSIPWGQHERIYRQWVEVCRQAAAEDPKNPQIKHI